MYFKKISRPEGLNAFDGEYSKLDDSEIVDLEHKKLEKTMFFFFRENR